MKLGRSFSMTVQTGPATGNVPLLDPSNAVVIAYPLTLVFEVCRSTLASPNTGRFMLYNLKEETRRKVLKDINDQLTRRSMVVNAGYVGEPKLPVIFSGDIWSAYSYRQKQDWITEINAFDGGFGILTGQADLPIQSGYNLQNVIRNLINTMPGVSVGAVGEIGATGNARGISVTGNSWENVQKLAPNSETFIDNGRANVIGENEYIIDTGPTFLIDADTGLLETPRKYQNRIDVKILFEPRMKVGMLIQMKSRETFYNGIFVVKGFTHAGTISGAVGGQLTTVISVWRGTEGLKGVNG